MRQQNAGGFVERASRGDAQHRVGALPFGRQLLALENWQAWHRHFLDRGVQRGVGFHIGGCVLGRGRAGLLLREVAGKFGDGIADLVEPFHRQGAALVIGLRQAQAGHRHLVIIGGERFGLEVFLGLVGSLGGISGQHALVEDFRGGQRRPVAEHDVEKRQPFDMTADHHEAHRQGGCQHQSDRSPQRRPQRRRGHHGDRRKAGVVAI